MGTRTNFYKNPSIAYKKDFDLNSVLQNLKAYNVATGNSSANEEQQCRDEESERRTWKKGGQKRRSTENRRPDRRLEIEELDGPMTHQDYIDKRRKEVNSSYHYEALTDAVLLQGTSTSALTLLNYGSDDSASESQEEDPQNSGHPKEADSIKTRGEQRFPAPGEPACVVCGKYGEYICNETDDDICSLECKAEVLQSLKVAEHEVRSQKANAPSYRFKCISSMPELGENTWDYNRNRWSTKRSNLCTYECWKCQRPGHLAEDCLMMPCSQAAEGKNRNSISKELLGIYRRCHQIGANLKAANCNVCRSSLSLATCLHCDAVLCDNAGHLDEHIKAHPSHQQYYSHKLKRLVKCCKSTCNMTNIKDLLACHYCFDKAFDKFYDMYTATWKRTGLSIIWGSICCEDHFEWHRFNCLNANAEDASYIIKKNAGKNKHIQLSDFIF
ncbi:uncharacterized protein [Euphorbia lathyris]|uniref:uncharacterized protein n=1 Tax=Euphorbia lathyris TaxID=212925 RepID=UPI0033135A00